MGGGVCPSFSEDQWHHEGDGLVPKLDLIEAKFHQLISIDLSSSHGSPMTKQKPRQLTIAQNTVDDLDPSKFPRP